MTLRTPLEVALGVELPLDMDDLDLGDYEAVDARDNAHEAALLADAVEAGEDLYAESRRDMIRAAVVSDLRTGDVIRYEP